MIFPYGIFISIRLTGVLRKKDNKKKNLNQREQCLKNRRIYVINRKRPEESAPSGAGA